MRPRDYIQLVTQDCYATGFESLNVKRSIEQGAASFSFSFAFDRIGEVPFRPYDEISAWVIPEGDMFGRDLVLTGMIDSISISSGDDRTVSISGRSKTGVLVDCSAEPKAFKKARLASIATDVCSPFGIDVNVSGSLTKDQKSEIGNFRIEVGETAWQALERLARMKGILITDTAAGELNLTTSGTAHSGVKLCHPGNIRTAELSVNGTTRFGEYVVFGQGKARSGSNPHNLSGTAGDGTIPINGKVRVSRIQAEEGVDTKDECQMRAEYQAARMMGKSITYTASVAGWTKPDKKPWVPNELVDIEDEICGVSCMLLCTAVDFKHDSQGPFTSLSLAPAAAFLPDSPDAYKKKYRKEPLTGIELWS